MINDPERFPLLSISSPTTINLCRNLEDHSSLPTIFIASYPKSGTTWLQAIVAALLYENLNHRDNSSSFTHISDVSPFFEVDRTWNDENIIQPAITSVHEKIGYRVFNTHLWWEMLPQGASFKYLYIVRDGKDVVLSFYHHLSHQAEGKYEGSFDNFLDDWCEGEIPFGKWITHLKKWYEAFSTSSNDDKCLLLRYESLVNDLPGEIEKISNFLFKDSVGDNDLNSISSSRIKKQKLCDSLSFQGMRRESARYQPVSVTWLDNFQFLRKGCVGDSLSFFTPEQHRKFDKMVEKAFTIISEDISHTEIPDWFKELNIYKKYEE